VVVNHEGSVDCEWPASIKAASPVSRTGDAWNARYKCSKQVTDSYKIGEPSDDFKASVHSGGSGLLSSGCAASTCGHLRVDLTAGRQLGYCSELGQLQFCEGPV
jgi:hypothetical protein